MVGYLALTGRLIAIPYRLIYSDEQLLAQQLQAEGCWFICDKHQDGLCDFEWSYFDRTLRNPEYHCPMRAADCIAKQSKSFIQLLPNLEIAKSARLAEFDTGDGVIKYLECLEGVIRVGKASSTGDNLSVAEPLILSCST